MSNSTSNTNTPPDILYHYTTQSGLLGIVKDKSIRATDILYLNDSTEYKYAFDLMHEKIKELIEGLPPKDLPPAIGSNKINKKDISQIKHKILESIQDLLKSLEKVKKHGFTDIFVCSFSKIDDQLSQWRGYCPDGNGFCIGFNTTRLIDLMEDKKFYLVKCIYEKENQIEIINTIFTAFQNELESIFNKVGKNITDDEIEKIEFKTIHKLIETAPKFKDESFHGEKEWRFSKRANHKEIKVEYREGLSMITPYVDILLANKEIHLPIERLIVGPTPHKDLSVSSAKSLLLNKGLKDCAEPSKIPYRAW